MRLELPCLPLIQERFWNAVKDKPAYEKIRYPEFEVRMFPQGWGSTALGFGDIGGQAVTTAYTTVVYDIYTGWCGVFFGERLAYTVLNPNQSFWEDVKRENMAEYGKSGRYVRQTQVNSTELCTKCNGSGEERFSDAAGSRDYRECSECNGKGFKNQTK